MDYTLNGGLVFRVSYKELKEEYMKYSSMCAEDFRKNAAKILHLCCIIASLKEIPARFLIHDNCIIHELAHLLDGTDTVLTIEEVQNEFIELMKLA
jgi:hypothetical protein